MRALPLVGALVALAAAACAHGGRPTADAAAPAPPAAEVDPGPVELPATAVEAEPAVEPTATPEPAAQPAAEPAPAATAALAPRPIERLDFEGAPPPPRLIVRQGFEPRPPGPELPESTIPDPLAVSHTPTPPEPMSLRGLCRLPEGADQPFLQDTRRWLVETFCGATLWFDGLFGGEPSVANARSVSGRIELSGIYTEAEGFDPKARLRLRYELPNLKRRINLFLDRDDSDRFIEDRREGLAIRSSVFGVDDDDDWLAGLGWSPPGRFSDRLDFRVGGRVKSAPEVFVQARWRRNFFVGDHGVWRFRETFFYENREGFGATTSIDGDRVLRQDLLLRWSGVGTFSEDTDGVEWRSAFVLYKNLGEGRAMAIETFSRGETEAPVELREFGSRLVFRRPVGKRPYLFGEAIVGYSFPQEDWQLEREGSAMVGFGLELLFGGDPF